MVFSVFADPATEDPYKLEDLAPAPIVVNSGPNTTRKLLIDIIGQTSVRFAADVKNVFNITPSRGDVFSNLRHQ